MSDYGVKPSGFVRKPLTEILREIEVGIIGAFGSSIIQNSESPMGQINGVFASAADEFWETAEDIYQALDPDQAEGLRVDVLAKIRILDRSGLSDIDLRKEIINIGVTKFNLKDVEQKIMQTSGLEYLQAFLNDDGALSSVGPALGDTVIAVIGGVDDEIADAMAEVLPIGGNTWGNSVITSTVSSGISQDFNLLRVSEVSVSLFIQISLNNDTFDQFEPDVITIIQGFVDDWFSDRVNGRDVDSFTIRRLIESKYPNIKLESFTATVGGSAQAQDLPVIIGFDQIATISESDVTMDYI